jgi:hypothetical protein
MAPLVKAAPDNTDFKKMLGWLDDQIAAQKK